MKALAIHALEMLACSGVLLAAYSILLERRVRYGWCRAYLLASTLLAAVIPLLRIPVWPGRTIGTVPAIVVPADDWTAHAVAETAPAITPEAVCLAVYLLGAGLIAGMMVWQALRIRSLRRGAEITRTDRFTLVRTEQRIASFSFFRSVYVWRETPADEMRAVVAHEASHIAHRHSVERIVMECMKAALWWNPFVWIAARRLTEAEEFEADSDVLAGGYDIEEYMKTIFRQLFGYSPEIANGLRDSLTKKRFKMMTTKTNGRHGLLRLAATLPALIGLLCAFSFTTRAEPIPTQMAAADAAPKTVRIKVEKDGKPLEGAVVLVPGTSNVTVTDAAGNASIRVQPGAKLAVSYDGCLTESIRISDQPGAESRTVTLKANPYVSGAAGAVPETDAKPLFLVDGVERANIDDLSADWIESISVLKSEAATAAYGPRGKNGVVVIKTRRKVRPAATDSAATRKAAAGREEPFLIAEVMPKFRGGSLNDYRAWVQGQIVYPAEAVRQKIEGRVIVTFVIGTDGSLGNLAVLQSSDKLLSKEALRVIASTPAGAWTAGEQRGEKVSVKFTMPVDFRLTPPAEKTAQSPAGEEPFLVVETMPAFQGGDIRMFRTWLQRNIRYPAEAMKQGLQGRVVVSFVVEKDGSLSNIRLLESPGKPLADEALRLLESSPKWTPGEQRGKKVRVKFSLPVDFRLQGAGSEPKNGAGKHPNSLEEIVVVGYAGPAK